MFYHYSTSVVVPELEKLMGELKAWCDAERGRQAQVSRELPVEPKVSRYLVNDWIFGRKRPSLDQYLALQAFLKKQRRRVKIRS
jgi:hypothetical protein